jgi:hypothetical protein
MTATAGLPGWRVIAGSVPGPNHANVGLPNQDSVKQRALPGGLHVLAVADGAGSAARASIGSNFAVEAAVDAAVQCFARPPSSPAAWRAAVPTFAVACLQYFDQQVVRSGGAPADYATTLLAVVVGPPFLAYVCVGDGFLVTQRQPGGSRLLVPPPATRESASETVFLTSPGREDDLRHGLLVDTGLSGIALGTDGVIDGLLDVTRAPDGRMHHSAPADVDAYLDMFRSPAVDAADLNRKLSSREFAASSGDDKTLLMAVRK